MTPIPKKLLSRVAKYFDGDMNRARIWFEIDNPKLANRKPKDCHQGKSWKLLERMIDAALKEYEDGRK